MERMCCVESGVKRIDGKERAERILFWTIRFFMGSKGILLKRQNKEMLGREKPKMEK